MLITRQEIFEETQRSHYNVAEQYKYLNVSEIQKIAKDNRRNFTVCCLNIEGNLNIGMIIRTAHLLGVKDVIIFGNRKIDNRSLVGAQNYTSITKIDGVDDYGNFNRPLFDGLMKLNNLTPVFIEHGGTSLEQVSWDIINPCFVFGNESTGIPVDFQRPTDYIISLPQFGVLRSYNVAAAAAMVMWDYTIR
jgi:tRNA G18 (ribose-2'-O)-methylase SpoU